MEYLWVFDSNAFPKPVLPKNVQGLIFVCPIGEKEKNKLISLYPKFKSQYF